MEEQSKRESTYANKAPSTHSYDHLPLIHNPHRNKAQRGNESNFQILTSITDRHKTSRSYMSHPLGTVDGYEVRQSRVQLQSNLTK